MLVSAKIDGPLISVLMLCYNHEKLVAAAVEGALDQTYSPLEIVIVDDGSSDGTAEVISATLAKRPDSFRATFVKNPRNMGPFEATRIGLGIVRGDFIVNAAGDDIMLPEMVAEMAKVWMAEGVSLVTANAYYIDEDSNSLARTHRDPGSPADDSFETLARDGANACCFGAGLGFDRNVYSTFGWPPNHLSTADIILPFWAYLLNGARFIQKPMLQYRVHAHNASLSLQADKSAGIEKLITLERIQYVHLAHALFMREQFDRLRVLMPERHAELEPRIAPLLAIQTEERTRKFIQARIELDEVRQQARAATNPA